MEETENWISTREAIVFSGYASEYLRALLRDKKIKSQKFGFVWQVDKNSLIEYMKDKGKEKPV